MTEQKMTLEEIQTELQGRVDRINKELTPLLVKYELELGAGSFIRPNGTIGAKSVWLDGRKKEGSGQTDTLSEA